MARIVVTLGLLLLAAGGFFGGGPTEAGPLNPFGMLFLVLSGIVLLAWDLFRGGFAAGREGPGMPIIRIAPMFIKGMVTLRRRSRPPRPSSRSAEG